MVNAYKLFFFFVSKVTSPLRGCEPYSNTCSYVNVCFFPYTKPEALFLVTFRILLSQRGLLRYKPSSLVYTPLVIVRVFERSKGYTPKCMGFINQATSCIVLCGHTNQWTHGWSFSTLQTILVKL